MSRFLFILSIIFCCLVVDVNAATPRWNIFNRRSRVVAVQKKPSTTRRVAPPQSVLRIENSYNLLLDKPENTDIMNYELANIIEYDP